MTTSDFLSDKNVTNDFKIGKWSVKNKPLVFDTSHLEIGWDSTSDFPKVGSFNTVNVPKRVQFSGNMDVVTYAKE